MTSNRRKGGGGRWQLRADRVYHGLIRTLNVAGEYMKYEKGWPPRKFISRRRLLVASSKGVFERVASIAFMGF